MKKTLTITILLGFAFCKLFAWERNFGFNSPAQLFSHYSIINSTIGDGLVTAGIEKTTGILTAHAAKLDYMGNVTWSKNYSFSSLWNTLSYRIANDFNQGYLITGVNVLNSSPGTFAPFVIRIDENGNPIKMAQIPVNGVGLTIRSCQGGNILVGGFESESLSNYSPNTRFAFLCKLDPNLNIIWYKRISGQTIAGYNNYDHVETVLPITMHGNEYYYVSGGITKDISLPGVTQTNIEILSQLYDVNGNLVWNNSQAENFNGTDAAYDPDRNEIYLISNSNISTPYISNFYRIDANSGAITLAKTYEGDPSATPYGCHYAYSNKINYINNKIIIYGYSRDYRYNSMTYNQQFIPYRVVTDRDFATPATTLYMLNTTNYGLSGLLGTHGSGTQNSFFTADMGVDFMKENNEHFAWVGYDNYMNNNAFSLHIAYDPISIDCTPRASNIAVGEFGDLPILNVGHLNIPKPNPPPLFAIAADLTLAPADCNFWHDLPPAPKRNNNNYNSGNAIDVDLTTKISFDLNQQQLQFNINIKNEGPVLFNIYNQIGQLIHTSSYVPDKPSLDIALKPGIYIAELKSGKNISRYRFIQ